MKTRTFPTNFRPSVKSIQMATHEFAIAIYKGHKSSMQLLVVPATLLNVAPSHWIELWTKSYNGMTAITVHSHDTPHNRFQVPFKIQKQKKHIHMRDILSAFHWEQSSNKEAHPTLFGRSICVFQSLVWAVNRETILFLVSHYELGGDEQTWQPCCPQCLPNPAPLTVSSRTSLW